MGLHRPEAVFEFRSWDGFEVLLIILTQNKNKLYYGMED